jgi:hypothetical protein
MKTLFPIKHIYMFLAGFCLAMPVQSKGPGQQEGSNIARIMGSAQAGEKRPLAMRLLDPVFDPSERVADLSRAFPIIMGAFRKHMNDRILKLKVKNAFEPDILVLDFLFECVLKSVFFGLKNQDDDKVIKFIINMMKGLACPTDVGASMDKLFINLMDSYYRSIHLYIFLTGHRLYM